MVLSVETEKVYWVHVGNSLGSIIDTNRVAYLAKLFKNDTNIVSRIGN